MKTAHHMQTRADLTFATWKQLVSRLILSRTGLHADDMPDIDYRGMYDDDAPACDAAQEAIDNARDDDDTDPNWDQE